MKTVLIAGATGAVGEYVAIDKLIQGGYCILLGNSDEKIEHLKKIIKKNKISNNQFSIYKCDLTKDTEFQDLMNKILKNHKKIDQFISSISMGKVGSLNRVEIDDFRDELELKLLSNIKLLKFLPMVANTECTAIILSGMFAKVKNYDFIINCTVNAALNNFCKTIAKEYMQNGIKINIVNPGAISSPSWQNIINTLADYENVSPETIEKEYLSAMQSSGLLEPKDISNLIQFLSSDEGNKIIGVELVIDNGSTL
ncbi:MAG: SDR family oxidoreductase [Bacilli bacterium]